MTLRKLEALLEAAEKATHRGKWTMEGRHPYLVATVARSDTRIMLDTPDTGGGPHPAVRTIEDRKANAAYIVAAANAAEDMARLLMEAYRIFEEEWACECASIPRCAACTWQAEARSRFGGDDAVSL